MKNNPETFLQIRARQSSVCFKSDWHFYWQLTNKAHLTLVIDLFSCSLLALNFPVLYASTYFTEFLASFVKMPKNGRENTDTTPTLLS